MSLLSEAYTSCHIIDKTTVPDGYGGVKTEWKEGAQIDCAIVLNNSIQAQIAQKQGTTAFYTITTPKSIVLWYHDIIHRDSDKKLFRVTSNGDDKMTPASAGLDMRQVTAEEIELAGVIG